MREYPPDLDRLRTLETYLQLQLAQVRKAISQAETSRPDTHPRVDPLVSDIAHDETLRPTPTYGLTDGAVRWWKLQPAVSTADKGKQGAILHRGDCIGIRAVPLLTREEAVVALTDQQGGEPTAIPCSRCRPDLGLL